jgi:tetratricopeptide (TPR) repeat protein
MRSVPFLFRFSISLAFLLLATGPSYAAESQWIELHSPGFDLYSSASPGSARDTIRQFERVRSFFLQALGGPPAKPASVRLVAFGSSKEFEPYRLNEYAVAYYHPAANYDYIVMSHAAVDVFPVAVHEYVHLLVRHSGLELPPWLNEGLAELYSTLHPLGDKIVVGVLIPGRLQALLTEKWVPLATILAADHDSPYYNEKNKAGSLYNEGWALTHMLYLRPEYRAKFSQFVHTIASGKDSAQALLEVYGRPFAQIEKDLQAYLRGSSFQGVLFPAKFDKEASEVAAQPVNNFDLGLVLADLLNRPGKEAASQAAFERLAQEHPKRPEPFRALGYLAWRAGRRDEALQQFHKAYDNGDRDTTFLWDYGRILEGNQREQAIQVLSELLAQDTNRMDVRLELAEAQLRANQAKAAITTIASVRIVTPADSQRFFRIAVYAHLGNGDREAAAATAKHFLEVAKTAEDKEAAEKLIDLTASRAAPVLQPPAEAADSGRPRMRRGESASESKHEAIPQPPARPSVSGMFVELECRGKQARMIIETATGRKAFLIEDPGKVTITSGSDGPVDMTCGLQKPPKKIDIGYDPAANEPGLDGLVRTLAF